MSEAANWERKAELLRKMQEDGKGELCLEPKLNGFPWPDMDSLSPQDSRGLSFYTTDRKLAAEMVQHKIGIGEPLVQAGDPHDVVKVRIEDKLYRLLADAEDAPALASPVGERRLWKLGFPQNVRVALAQCEPHYDTGLSDVLLLRSRDAENVQMLQNLLVTQGFIAKKPPRTGYRLQSADDGSGFVAAVSIPPELADIIRVTQTNNCEEFSDFLPTGRHKALHDEGALNFDTLVALASKHMPAVERVVVESSKRPSKEVAPAKPVIEKQPLEHYAPALQKHLISFQAERRLDGEKDYVLQVKMPDDGLVQRLCSGEHTVSPLSLRLTNQDGSSASYHVPVRDYHRLLGVLPAESITYKPELPAYIPESQLAQKYLHARQAYSHISDLYVSSVQNKGVKKYYLYVVADTPERLTFFLNGMPVKNEVLAPHMLTSAHDKPCVMRMSLTAEVAKDIATQPLSQRILRDITLHDVRNAPSATSKALDNRVRRKFQVSFTRKTVLDQPVEKAEDMVQPDDLVQKKSRYEVQQALEDDVVTLLQDAMQQGLTRNGYQTACFVNVKRQKDKSYRDADRNMQKLQFGWVEPKLYVQLPELAYEKLRSRPEFKRAGIIEEVDHQGGAVGAQRTIAVMLSPDGMERLHDMLPLVETLREQGKDGDTLELGAVRYRVASYFTGIERDYNQMRETLQMGFSQEEAPKYIRYTQWKQQPKQYPKPEDEVIQFVEERLAQMQEKQAQDRAVQALSSRDMLLVDVKHLSDGSVSQIEAQMQQIDSLHASIRHVDELMGHLQAVIGKLRSSPDAQSIYGIGETLKGMESEARSMVQHRRAMGEQIDEITGEVAAYKDWVSRLGNVRTAKHVLILKANEETSGLFDAIDDDEHMTRSPLLMKQAAGAGHNVLMLFPTEKTLNALVDKVRQREDARLANQLRQSGGAMAPEDRRELVDRRVGQHFQRLTDEVVEPHEILPLLRKRLHVAQEDEPSVAPALQNVTQILGRLRQPLETARPQLAAQREEHTYTGVRAQEAIGDQPVLLFTVSRKRDLRHLKDIMHALEDAKLLQAPRYYGSVEDATVELTKEQQRIQGLQESVGALRELSGFYNEVGSALAQMLYDKEASRDLSYALNRLEPLQQELPLMEAKAKELADKMESLGVYVDFSNLPTLPSDLDVLTGSAALAAAQHKPQYDAAVKLFRRAMVEAENEIFSANERDVDVVDRARDLQWVTVHERPSALLDMQDQPVRDLDMAFNFTPNGNACTLKLFVKPELRDALQQLFQQKRGRYGSELPGGERGMTTEQLADAVAMQPKQGSMR